MFTVEIIGDRAIVAHLETMNARVQAALERTVTRLAFELEAKVKQKLQGEVLQHRTGTLSSSITNTVQVAPDSILGRVFSNGTCKYAAIHEFGFEGTESVRAYVRRQTMVFGRPMDPPIMVDVAPFERHMHMPERSFLRSTLTENAAYIERELTKAVVAAAMEGASNVGT